MFGWKCRALENHRCWRASSVVIFFPGDQVSQCWFEFCIFFLKINVELRVGFALFRIEFYQISLSGDA